MSDLYSIDEFGRAVVDSTGLFELWMQDVEAPTLAIVEDPEVVRYNEQCLAHGKDQCVLSAGEAQKPISHEDRKARWLIPESYADVDVRDWCLRRCATREEHERVEHEMMLYERANMVPVLRALIHMIAVFRENKIVWGVGRGSSVASYVLFLIGVHRIDSIKFGLDVEEFLR